MAQRNKTEITFHFGYTNRTYWKDEFFDCGLFVGFVNNK